MGSSYVYIQSEMMIWGMYSSRRENKGGNYWINKRMGVNSTFKVLYLLLHTFLSFLSFLSLGIIV